jgi:hypothetical protein
MERKRSDDLGATSVFCKLGVSLCDLPNVDQGRDYFAEDEIPVFKRGIE